MKKMIAIVITLIFIFEGTGYCLRIPILCEGKKRAEKITMSTHLNPNSSIEELQDKFSLNPHDLVVRNMFARVLVAKRKYYMAAEIYEETLRLIESARNGKLEIHEAISQDNLDKEQAIVYTALIKLNSIMHEYERAIDLGKRALARFPGDIRIRTDLMNTYIHARRPAEAIVIGEEAMTTGSFIKDDFFITILINAYIYKEQFQKAIDLGEKAMAMSSGNIKLISTLIKAYLHAGRFDEAMLLGQKTIRREPRDVIVRYLLMSAFIGVHRHAEAIRLGEETIRLFPNEFRIRFILMDAYVYAGEFQKAIKLGEETKGLPYSYPYKGEISYRMIDAYIYEAEKYIILGEIAQHKDSYRNALRLGAIENSAVKSRLVYMGLLHESSNGAPPIKDSDIVGRVYSSNIDENLILTSYDLDHAVAAHTPGETFARRSGFITAFPKGMEKDVIKELILKTAEYGVSFNKGLPWWNHDSLIWYVDSDLAEKTGIERMEIRIDRRTRKILTGFPLMGREVSLFREGYKIDPKLVNILPIRSNLMWNKYSTRKGFLVLAGIDAEDVKWGMNAAVHNDTVFGNMGLIQREYIVWKALWEGTLIGNYRVEDSRVLFEFYAYKVPSEFGSKADTLYIYIDPATRRMINVTDKDPRKVLGHNKRQEFLETRQHGPFNGL